MSRADLLSTVPHFAGIPAGALDRLAARGRVVEPARGTAVVAEGSADRSLFVVLAGEVLVQKATAAGGARALGRLGPGSLVGEVSIFDSRPRSASVVAADGARLLEIPGAALDAWIEEEPAAAARFLRRVVEDLCAKIRSTNDRLRDQVIWGLGPRS